jgi:predicted nuclease with TOPRIM domain
MATAEPLDATAIPLPFDDYVEKPSARGDLEAAVEDAFEHAHYGRLQDELYTLASRIAILEANLDRELLAAHDDYRALRERFDELQAEFESVTAAFSDREFWAEFDRNSATSD